MPSYRALIRRPLWRRYLLASTAARLPITMGVFGMVLAGRALGSFSLGARLAALYTITGAVTALWRGRRLDRGDLHRGLQRDGLAFAAVTAVLAVAVHAHAAWPVAAVLACGSGVTLASIPGGYRSLLPSVVPAGDVGPAYALDAVSVEVCFTLGPAAAALVAWFAGAAGVFALMAVLGLIGAVAVTRLPSAPPRGAPTDAVSPLRVPVIVGVLVGTLALGTALGVLDATFPALAVALGSRAALGGIFITLMALGSACAGLVLGPRIAASADLPKRAAQIVVVFGVVVIPMSLVHGLAPVAALALLAGAPFALMSTAGSVLIQRSVDPARSSEAFSLLNAAILGGDAIGSAVASTVLGPLGPHATLAVAAVGPVVIGCALVALVHVARSRAGAAGGRDPAGGGGGAGGRGPAGGGGGAGGGGQAASWEATSSA
jgi:hypothetical protein